MERQDDVGDRGESAVGVVRHGDGRADPRVLRERLDRLGGRAARRDPYGDEIYHDNKHVSSGGELDVDANYPCSDLTSSPLENVYWPYGGAPSGEYEVYVNYYRDCTGQGTVSYRVTVRTDDTILDTLSGNISPGDRVFITSFEY